MDSDALIAEARMHQTALLEHRAQAKEHQDARDRLIHELRESDPERWSLAALAEAVGISRGLVQDILRRQQPE